MAKKTFALRGAITLDADTKDAIKESVTQLLREMLTKNSIREGEAVSLLISSTKDITALYPAAAVRESGLIDVPLFSASEPDIRNSLPLCVRFMLTVIKKKKFEPKHVYLKNARRLRPDLVTREVEQN